MAIINFNILKYHYKLKMICLMKILEKMMIFFHDISIDFNDYKNPIKPFINEVFLQLNPESTLKMNKFFMYQFFNNSHDLFFSTQDEQN